MTKFIFTTLLIAICLSVNGQLKIETEAIKTHISAEKDSVFIQGLDNTLHIYSLKDSNSQFSFQLVGFDPILRTSPFPSFRYTNIPGGEFTFRYKGENDTSFKFIKVSVMEAIWQKWWFWPMILGYIVLLGGIGTFLFFQYNYRQKLKMSLVRNKIASDLHDEVGSNLSSISIFTEVLRKQIKKDPSQVDNILNRINQNSQESVTLMQDTVWAINPSNDTIEKLIQRVINFGNEILGSKGIAFSQHIDIDVSRIRLGMEARKDCYLILKEAINNTAKYSEAFKAKLSISQNGESTIFSFQDNGIGFDMNSSQEGNGLQNFETRAEKAGFDLSINSALNEGTEVILKIPSP